VICLHADQYSRRWQRVSSADKHEEPQHGQRSRRLLQAVEIPLQVVKLLAVPPGPSYEPDSESQAVASVQA